VAPHNHTAFEPQEDVLADRLDAFEHTSVDHARDAGRETPGVRAPRAEALTDQHL
jgi:hypothetical protein